MIKNKTRDAACFAGGGFVTTASSPVTQQTLMKPWPLVGVRLCLLGCWLAAALHVCAAESPPVIQIIESRGLVEVSTDGNRWVRTQTGQVLRAQDRLRTGPDSRAALRWSDSSVVPFGPVTAIEIVPPQQAATTFSLRP